MAAVSRESVKQRVMTMLPARWQDGLRRLRRRSRVARATVGHYVDGVVSRRQLTVAASAYPEYFRDRRRYEELAGVDLRREDDDPQLLDRTAVSPFDPHYTYQDAWAARRVFESRVPSHVDVGSRITYVIGLAAFVEVTYVDLRPLEASIEGLTPLGGSILDLPFADRSVQSLSCLHVAEHIGLGRYGDPLDPEGTVKAAKELQRVLADDGRLYFSLPVGEPLVAFNAHRVHDPGAVLEWFDELELVAFSAVDDDGTFLPGVDPATVRGNSWGCGFYELRRNA